MFEITGSKGKAVVMLDSGLDSETMKQLYEICNSHLAEEATIVIMPDCHKGENSCIGFTSSGGKYLSSLVVGVDIGCGISAYELQNIKRIKLEEFDKFIHENIPSGFAKRNRELLKLTKIQKQIAEETNQNINDVELSLGTLGGGNHFIELDEGQKSLWLTIHTGSRNFGYKIAYYFDKATKNTNGYMEIGSELATKYLAFMLEAQKYADLNRYLISKEIFKFFKNRLVVNEVIHSVHNYIGNDGIIRKGAISAYKGQKVIIPLNMRDGSIIGIGKGNKDWNYSAPHGAGRNMSRSGAKKNLSLEAYKKVMEGVYSTCVNSSTLDEAPMAYKDPNMILNNIINTVEAVEIIKPIYNFKAS